MEMQGMQAVQNNPEKEKKNKFGGLTLPDFKN